MGKKSREKKNRREQVTFKSGFKAQGRISEETFNLYKHAAFYEDVDMTEHPEYETAKRNFAISLWRDIQEDYARQGIDINTADREEIEALMTAATHMLADMYDKEKGSLENLPKGGDDCGLMYNFKTYKGEVIPLIILIEKETFELHKQAFPLGSAAKMAKAGITPDEKVVSRYSDSLSKDIMRSFAASGVDPKTRVSKDDMQEIISAFTKILENADEDIIRNLTVNSNIAKEAHPELYEI